jgi:hypothetical protein
MSFRSKHRPRLPLWRRPGQSCSPQFGQAVGKLRFRESSFPSTPTSRRRYWIDYSVFVRDKSTTSRIVSAGRLARKKLFPSTQRFCRKSCSHNFCVYVNRTDVTISRRQKLPALIFCYRTLDFQLEKVHGVPGQSATV